jgi:hypothetical protein
MTNNLTEIEDATRHFIHQYKDLEFLWKETLVENFAKFLDQGEDPRETFKWMADKILAGV